MWVSRKRAISPVRCRAFFSRARPKILSTLTMIVGPVCGGGCRGCKAACERRRRQTRGLASMRRNFSRVCPRMGRSWRNWPHSSGWKLKRRSISRVDLISPRAQVDEDWFVEGQVLRHLAAMRGCQIEILAAELRHVNCVFGLFGRDRGVLPLAVLLEEGFLADLA